MDNYTDKAAERLLGRLVPPAVMGEKRAGGGPLGLRDNNDLDNAAPYLGAVGGAGIGALMGGKRNALLRMLQGAAIGGGTGLGMSWTDGGRELLGEPAEGLGPIAGGLGLAGLLQLLKEDEEEAKEASAPAAMGEKRAVGGSPPSPSDHPLSAVPQRVAASGGIYGTALPLGLGLGALIGLLKARKGEKARGLGYGAGIGTGTGLGAGLGGAAGGLLGMGGGGLLGAGLGAPIGALFGGGRGATTGGLGGLGLGALLGGLAGGVGGAGLGGYGGYRGSKAVAEDIAGDEGLPWDKKKEDEEEAKEASARGKLSSVLLKKAMENVSGK